MYFKVPVLPVINDFNSIMSVGRPTSSNFDLSLSGQQTAKTDC